MIFLGSIFAIFATLSTTSAVCPTDWLELAGSCWFVSKVDLNWSGASSACQAFHGELAVIKDQNTWSNIKSLIGGAEGDRFWIDGTDMLVEGDWLWASIDTDNKIDTTTIGVPGIEQNSPHSDCLLIDRDAGNKWVAETCDDDAFYICEHK